MQLNHESIRVNHSPKEVFQASAETAEKDPYAFWIWTLLV